MAGRSSIKYKMTRRQLLAVFSAHDMLLLSWEPTDAHAVLLWHFLKIFRSRLLELKANMVTEKKTFTFKLTEIEALAFCQIWATVDVLSIGYGGHVIQLINNEIDIQRKNIKLIANETRDEADHRREDG